MGETLIQTGYVPDKRKNKKRNWIEKSIEFYTRGSHLKAHCQQKLNDAVLKLEEIKVSSDGKVSKKEIE